MSVKEAVFNKEKELQDWTFSHIETFFPQTYLVDGFQVTTASGKNGVPDGFAFNFAGWPKNSSPLSGMPACAEFSRPFLVGWVRQDCLSLHNEVFSVSNPQSP